MDMQRGEKMDDKLTSKDAITVLRSLQDWLYLSGINGGTSLQRKAIDIAIEALKQPKIIHCEDCKYGMLDPSFPHQWFCKYKGDEWNNSDYFCGHARKR